MAPRKSSADTQSPETAVAATASEDAIGEKKETADGAAGADAGAIAAASENAVQATSDEGEAVAAAPIAAAEGAAASDDVAGSTAASADAAINPYRASGVDREGTEVVVVSQPMIFLGSKYMPGDRLRVTAGDADMLEDDGVIED
jgi:hypothetical protein